VTGRVCILACLAMLAWLPAQAASPLLCRDFQPQFGPEADDPEYADARKERREGSIERSISMFNDYLAQKPDHYFGTYNLALAHLALGNQAEANRLFLVAMGIREQQRLCEATIFNTTGYQFLKRDRFVEAEVYFDIGLNEVNFNQLKSASSRRKLLGNAAITKVHLGKFCDAVKLALRSDNESGNANISAYVNDIIRGRGEDPSRVSTNCDERQYVVSAGQFFSQEAAQSRAQELESQLDGLPVQIQNSAKGQFSVNIGNSMSYGSAAVVQRDLKRVAPRIRTDILTADQN